MTGCRDPQRIRRMAEMYRAGATYQQVGDAFGVSRQAVQQTLAQWLSITAKDGGATAAREALAIKRIAGQRSQRETASLRRYGCSYDLFLMLREIGAVAAYRSQKHRAADRVIDWKFSLWTWWCVWRDSGKWEKRGLGHGYCMCRFGDEGPYSPSNVYIATNGWNAHEGSRRSIRPPGVIVTGEGRYRALVRTHKDCRTVGVFETPESAAVAYAEAVADETLLENARNRSYPDCGALRRWRKQSRVTVYSAAYRAGVAEQTWRRWEAGARPIPATMARRLATIVGVPAHRLTIDAAREAVEQTGAAA